MDAYLRTEKRQRSHFLSLPWKGDLYYPSVVHCGRERHSDREGLNSRPHEHAVYHLLLFFGGENEFFFGDNPVPCVKGLLALSSPGNIHNFYPRLSGEIFYSEVTFEYISRDNRLELPLSRIFSLLFGEPCEGKDLILFSEEETNRFLHLQRKLQNSLAENSRTGQFRSDLLLLELFTLIREKINEETVMERVSREEGRSRTEHLKGMIRDRFPGKISLDELARETGWTKSYMIRKFRERYGITPMEYDRRLRIDAAADLILTTNRKMEDIAESLGFCDVFHFIRTFKKYKGVTPGKYV
ncbi:MAG: helix-turn-helix transcriptional regulator [Spirochaetales bacterium]|nr:helix-turn-helix transcriptional regulator [Spirochaetales bacterium]